MDAEVLVVALQDPAAFAKANTTFQKTATELAAFAEKKTLPQAFTAFSRNVTENMAPRAAKLSTILADPATPAYLRDSDSSALVQFYNNLVQSADSLSHLEAAGTL